MSFLDAFQGYHQIPLAADDQEETAFVTPIRNYHYKVLIQMDNGIQRPVYYVSKSLHEAETHYLPLEKAILAVVQATRKLPHYFQAHTIIVLTQLSLRSILRSDDYTGRVTKWGTILGA